MVQEDFCCKILRKIDKAIMLSFMSKIFSQSVGVNAFGAFLNLGVVSECECI